MMGIVVGTNRLEYCKIKKRDVVRHFFTTRNQLYKFYPDGLIPMEIYHDGAYIETQSVTMFEENGTRPYHTKYAEQYDKDVILMNIDEHKLMSPRRSKLSAISGVINNSDFKTAIPWLITGVILAYAFISQWVGA